MPSYLIAGTVYSILGYVGASLNLFQCILDSQQSKRFGLGGLQRFYHLLLTFGCFCFGVSETLSTISMTGSLFPISAIFYYVMMDVLAVCLLIFYYFTIVAFYSTERQKIRSTFELKTLFQFACVSTFLVHMSLTVVAFVENRHVYAAFGTLYLAIVVMIGIIATVLAVRNLFKLLRMLEMPLKSGQNKKAMKKKKSSETMLKGKEEMEEKNRKESLALTLGPASVFASPVLTTTTATAPPSSSPTRFSPCPSPPLSSPAASPPVLPFMPPLTAFSIPAGANLGLSISTATSSPIHSGATTPVPTSPLRRSESSIRIANPLTERMSRYSRFVFVLVFFSVLGCFGIAYFAMSAVTHLNQPFNDPEAPLQPLYIYYIDDGIACACLLTVTYIVWIPVGGVKRKEKKESSKGKNGNGIGNDNPNSGITDDESLSGNSSRLSRNSRYYMARSLMWFNEIWFLVFQCECFQACCFPESYNEKKIKRNQRLKPKRASILGAGAGESKPSLSRLVSSELAVAGAGVAGVKVGVDFPSTSNTPSDAPVSVLGRVIVPHSHSSFILTNVNMNFNNRQSIAIGPGSPPSLSPQRLSVFRGSDYEVENGGGNRNSSASENGWENVNESGNAAMSERVSGSELITGLFDRTESREPIRFVSGGLELGSDLVPKAIALSGPRDHRIDLPATVAEEVEMLTPVPTEDEKYGPNNMR